MKRKKTRIGEGGRIVIPAEYRQALGLKTGDWVVLALDEDGLRIETFDQITKRVQALVRRYIPEGRSLSDELIRERREEAARE